MSSSPRPSAFGFQSVWPLVAGFQRSMLLALLALCCFSAAMALTGIFSEPAFAEPHPAPSSEVSSPDLAPALANAQLSSSLGRKFKVPKQVGKTIRDAGARLGKALEGAVIMEVVEELWTTLFPPGKPDLATELEALIPQLVEEIAERTGPERQLLVEQLQELQNQLSLVRDAQVFADAVGEARDQQLTTELEALREQQLLLLADQRALLEQVDGLQQRIVELEAEVGRLNEQVGELNQQVGELSDRLAAVEDALIASCLDVRNARRYGEEGYPVLETRNGWLLDAFDSESVRINTRAMLNACNPDLTERGMLFQFALTTYGLTEEMRLYITVKDLRRGGFDPTRLNAINRLEYPIYYPQYPIDGAVQEIFLPYVDLPIDSSQPFAIAFVLTHDGAPVYSLPDQVVRCLPGVRMKCRWGR
ncbi:MAG: hypothetical protein AAGD01_08160 [Acidobacteriota bacterium]